MVEGSGSNGNGNGNGGGKPGYRARVQSLHEEKKGGREGGTIRSLTLKLRCGGHSRFIHERAIYSCTQLLFSLSLSLFLHLCFL